MLTLKSVVKAITSILGVAVVTLFFVLLLTYDFSKEIENNNNSSIEDLSNELYEEIDKSINDSSNFNIFKLGIDEDYINKIATYLIKKEGINILESDYWTVSNIDFKLLNNKIEIYIYVKYHNNFTYKLKIKAAFTVKETSNSYKFSLKNMKIGSLYIPKTKIQRILANKELSSIGYIYDNTIDLLPFGSYDEENFTYTIYKKEIVDNIESGLIGELINIKSKNMNKLLAPIIDIIFENNLLTLKFVDSEFDMLIDYSMFINNKKTVDNINPKNTTNTTKDSTYYFDIMLNSLINQDSVEINNDDLNYVFFQNIYNSVDYYKSKYFKFYTGGVDVFDNELHLYISLSFLDKYSLFNFIYKKENNEYVLDRIEIGRDNSESDDSYIVSTSSENKARFLKTLYFSNIKGNIYLNTINVISLIKGENINYSDITIESNSLYLKMSKSSIDISSLLLGDDFNKDLNIDIDYSTKEKLMCSFKLLSTENRIFYFNKIKDYYKDNFSVYNYICNLIG